MGKMTVRDEKNLYKLSKQHDKQNNNNKTTFKDLLCHRNNDWSTMYRTCNLHKKTDNYDISCATCSKNQDFLWTKVEGLEKEKEVGRLLLREMKFSENVGWV